MDDRELRARILLNVAVPANEGRLRVFLANFPATEAWDYLVKAESNLQWQTMALSRARARVEQFDLRPSLDAIQSLKLRFLRPEELSGLSDLGSQAPWVIFAKGNIVQMPFVAVVGTRSFSLQGGAIARQIVRQLGVDQGLVSGGANGIDLVAHETAKKMGVNQLMVLAGGLDQIYPQRAADLVRSGFEGAAISEMPPTVRSGKLGFLNRNRLIAAICHRLYLVEAPTVSGSINTAQHALSLRREVEVCVTNDCDFSPGGRWFAKKPGVKMTNFSYTRITK
jgi:DNA processing protein